MRKEKYIREKKDKEGNLVFELRIKYFNDIDERKEYSKSFNAKHYVSSSEALKEAVKHRNDILNKLDTVGIISTKKKVPTLKEVYEEKKKLFPLSYETERKHDIYFNKYMGNLSDMPINKITSKHITISLNAIIQSDDSIIKRVFAIWKQIFRCAIMSDYVAYDPTMKIIVPKSEKIKEQRSVEMNCDLNDVIMILRNYGTTEVSKFNANIIAYALIVMYYTGIRPSECFALQKDDIDFNNQTITINKAVGSKKNEELTIKRTKNTNSIRTIPFNDDLIPIFKEIIEIQPNAYLFARYDGKLNGSRFYTFIIRNALKGTDIDFRAYMLRHKFSTDLVKNNIDLRTIQELMGHKDSKTTLSYARSNEELKRLAVNKKISLGEKLGDKKIKSP